ncbi:hypothetical protein ENHY17A_100340 [Moraxellaceae bacterium 17A]|nr:hypothetical protein ENHY17A_100340 [Moraxellaceae bacterium 17A]
MSFMAYTLYIIVLVYYNKAEL